MAGRPRTQRSVDRRSLEGIWHDRTQEYRFGLRGKEPEPGQFTTVEILTLDPLPCWKHLPPEEYRRRTAELVAEIEEEARVARKAKGLEPLGADAVWRQQPHARPNRTKKSPAPLFHTASRRMYLELRDAYSRFVAAFRDAAAKLEAETGRWHSRRGASPQRYRSYGRPSSSRQRPGEPVHRAATTDG